MAPDEHTRHEVQTRLAEVIGAEAASYVMTHLPPEEWPSLASKADITELRAATTDIQTAMALRSDMEHGFELLTVQAESFREVFLQRLETADANMRTTVADLGSALRREMVTQTRTMIVALATIMVALVAAFIAAR